METFVAVAAFVLIFLGAGTFLGWQSIQRRRQAEEEKQRQLRLVQESSTYYQGVLKLNAQYSFHTDFPRNRTLTKTVHTKNQYDTFRFSDLLERYIMKDLTGFSTMLAHVRENQTRYAAYLRDLEHLEQTSAKERNIPAMISAQAYQELEKQLVQSVVLHPAISLQIACCVRYTSPKGKNSYQNRQTFAIDALEKYRQKCVLTSEIKDQKKYERAKMSASLRYDVLKRDGFRCQICGATQADGVKLHVDHVVPIAKGGKTEFSNLRTLCERCNLGKGAKEE